MKAKAAEASICPKIDYSRTFSLSFGSSASGLYTKGLGRLRFAPPSETFAAFPRRAEKGKRRIFTLNAIMVWLREEKQQAEYYKSFSSPSFFGLLSPRNSIGDFN